MSKINLKPFKSIRQLLHEALQSAILNDQELIRCGGYMKDKRAEKNAVNKIKAMRRLLKLISPDNAFTKNEEMQIFLQGLIDAGCGKMMTLQEIKAAYKKRKSP